MWRPAAAVLLAAPAFGLKCAPPADRGSFNDLESVRRAFEGAHRGDVAAVIVAAFRWDCESKHISQLLWQPCRALTDWVLCRPTANENPLRNGMAIRKLFASVFSRQRPTYA